MGFDVKAALARALDAENPESNTTAKAKAAKAAKHPAIEGIRLASLAGLAADHVSGSDNSNPAATPRPDGLHPDAGAYLDFLLSHGPAAYGAAASDLDWPATRAWQAEARLRAAGLVRLSDLGKAHPIAIMGGNP